MYRYSLRKYNDQLYVMGVIRVGTLHDFRNVEHKKGAADPEEGTKTVSHHIKHLHVADSNDPNIRQSRDMKALGAFRAVKIGKDSKNITFSNVSMSQSFNAPDCFIFCTSKYKSKETMKQFEGADSCMQIKDVNAFYKYLTQTIDRITPVMFRGIHEVVYQDREEIWNGVDWGRHPAMLKGKEFKKQGELRAIWQPRFNLKIEPLRLCNYRLGSCLAHVSV